MDIDDFGFEDEFAKEPLLFETLEPKSVNRDLATKAMKYLANQWDKLVVYGTDGEFRLSNIMTENAIRPFAVGRKAWLFCDTPRGAHASSVHYSLIETAKLHGLESYQYLNSVFKALPYADTVENSKTSYLGVLKKN